MMKAAAVVIAGLITIALLDAAVAAERHKRARSETGPLIMSGSFGPQTNARRSRTADICVPVTIKRRSLTSLLSNAR